MTHINKQNFLAELGKLLTFMYEDDRQTALAMYSKLFDDAENEQGLLQLLVSPTRQAVVIARAYDSRDRRLDTHSAPGGNGKAESGYAKAIDKIRELAVAKEIVSERSEDQFSLFDTPAETAEPKPLLPAEKEAAEPEQDETEEAPAEEKIETESVSAPMPASMPEQAFVPDDEPEEKSVRRARPLLLILYILFAVPLTLAGLVILVLPTVLCMALSGASGYLCFIAVSGAFGGGFAVFADMMVVIGIALVLLALALLFLGAAIWFIGGAMVSLVNGVLSLGGKWCYKEVQAE